MKAQIIQNSDGITNIIYPNRYRKWVSISALKHLRFINLLRKTEENFSKVMGGVADGTYSKDLALKDVGLKFKKLQDEVLGW